MEYRVLGPLELRRGRAVGKQGALLGLLLLYPNRAVSGDRLMEALWNGNRPRSAENLVQGYVSQVRKTVGPGRIRTVPSGYLLSVGRDELDSLRFRRLAEQGLAALEAGEPDRAAALLREGLALWRGDVLAGLRSDLGADPEALRLAELRIEALEARVEADLARGHAVAVVPDLEALVAAEPLRERPRELLMLSLYRSGRQADALEEYRRARRALAGGLGIEPGEALKRLERAILRQDPSLEGTAAASLLGAPPTALLGRVREVERSLGLLRRPDVRLLTLTGTGGIGKTRLAVELGRLLADDFPDGAHIVPLASVTDPALVLSTIARTLGVQPGPHGSASALRLHLRERSLLLVLDNVEYVLAAAPDLADLLADAPGLTLLVTSLSPLRLLGEHELDVPPLALPEPGSDDLDELLSVPSVALFVVRARAANGAFVVDAGSAPVIAEICRRLDGLPLAIELAASRTKLLPPRALLERLGHRLDLLTGGARDAPPRQRTLRATIDWSHDLLDPDEQRLFARLGVFPGGCTLDAAEAVCGDGAPILDGLASLVDKSLLRSTGDEPRFSMLETQREYALERLEGSGEAAAIRQRHLEFFAGLADQAGREIRTGADQQRWYARLDADLDSFRAALVHAIGSGSAGLALQICIGINRFLLVRGHVSESLHWLLGALGLDGEQPAALRAPALTRAAAHSTRQGLHAEARSLVEEAMELYRRLDDPEGLATATLVAGNVCGHEGDLEGALELFRRAAESHRQIGNRADFAAALNNAGCVRFLLGDYEGAAADCAEAAAASAREGDRLQVGGVRNLACALLELGDEAGAAAKIRESIAISRELGTKEELAAGLEASAAVAARRGEHERAVRLLGAAEMLRESLGTEIDPFELAIRSRVLDAVEEALDGDTLAAALAEGRSIGLEEAIEQALGVEPSPLGT